ncbi:uncharacterized protein N7469_010683 [Penicillium citrinum]|uniref:Uncharacterized protein n=2 Tax=Penicillium TaxID=5073 RepID=A0A9W9TGD8_PENCI|nr:uncharacterized protein N7469_010683 [Penicillium citrinum]KAJ5221796.1 hypothetical protein N7469_010683 [Penicillium citrinum]KAJ5596764.1 hypothetical protein N7450_003222 [Penicillium hetheringtonii]
MQFFFPRQHRHYKLTHWLMAVEFPFVVVILTLTGIASHNLYRSLLWQDGADNGFNSAPDEALYAAANHRPYSAPMVWSSFITNYNLVIGVLSTFILIVKLPLHSMHIFFPPIAATVHGALFILYIVSARYQAGSDTSDPKHPQPGAPWYIAKSCSVAAHQTNIGYCKQAKSLFAITVIVIIIYAVEFGISVHSCFITEEEKAKVLELREEKRIEKEFEEEVLKSPSMAPMSAGMIPRTPGFPPLTVQPIARHGAPISPFTPRHLAFNRLGNGSTSSDLPLRDNSSMPTPQIPSQPQTIESQASPSQPMYFPPPPKKATKN